VPSCPRCGTENPAGAIFCSYCAENLANTRGLPSGSEGLVDASRILCQKLGIDDPPESVSWQDMYYKSSGSFSDNFSRYGGTGRPVTPDFPIIINNKILLKPWMEGKLSTEDWRPLLASSLVLFKKLSSQRNQGFVLRLSPIFIMLGILFALIAVDASSPALVTPAEVVIFGVIALPAIGILSAFRVMYYSQSLGLVADRRAAELVGREQFLAVLLKLDALKKEDFQNRNGINWMRYGDLPSLKKRIENMQTMQVSSLGINPL
jgi:zinc-ribbon domain